MATLTSNISLTKPELADTTKVREDMNANSDIIDGRFSSTYLAVQSKAAVDIDGGSLAGITDFAVGTSGSPKSLTYNGTKAMSVYTTCASTNASTNYEPALFNSVLTGAGQVGGRFRFNMESNVVLGGWANALKASTDWKTSGGVTGLGSALCAEMTMMGSTMAASGTYGVMELELVCPTSWAGTNPVSFIYAEVSGATKGNFDDYGYLFTIAGVTDGAAHIWYDHTGAAAQVTNEWIRIKTPNGTKYLAVYDAIN